MKTRSLLIVVALLAITTARAAEVKFQTLTWDQAKAAALQQHKAILVDGFTDWCYWCKVLDKKTFANDTVAEFTNSNFVCVKYDMERDFGRTFAMKYRVSGYPTELVFTADGKLVCKAVGYLPPKEFLAMLHKALDPKEQTVYKGISDKIDLDFPPFYQDAFNVNGKRKMPDSSEVLNYLDKQRDLQSEVNWSVISRFVTRGKYAQYVLDHAQEYATLYGKGEVNDKVSELLYRSMDAAADANDVAALQLVIGHVDTYMLEGKDEEKRLLLSSYYKKVGDWKNFSSVAEEQLAAQQFKDADQINDFCWTLYQKCDDRDVLKKAAGWMKKGVAIDPSYNNVDTYAALLFKCGDYDDAEHYANQAIATGMAAKTDVKSSKELLAKIEKAKHAQ